MTEAVVEFKDVKKTYGHTKALRGVSFSLSAGSFLSIFGPNGAGKSTLLKVLSTMTKASSGEIFFSGIPLKELKDDFRKNFGVISHEPFLYENLTAFDNLVFYSRLYGVKNPEEVADKLLERVELKKRKFDKVRSFSRGMLQRLSIARALVHEPEIILLDEPYTGLDQHASMVLTNILKEQFDLKKTIIMVTHNLQRGYELATDIAIVKDGKFVMYEKKENVCEEKFEDIYIEAVS